MVNRKTGNHTLLPVKGKRGSFLLENKSLKSGRFGGKSAKKEIQGRERKEGQKNLLLKTQGDTPTATLGRTERSGKDHTKDPKKKSRTDAGLALLRIGMLKRGCERGGNLSLEKEKRKVTQREQRKKQPRTQTHISTKRTTKNGLQEMEGLKIKKTQKTKTKTSEPVAKEER